MFTILIVIQYTTQFSCGNSDDLAALNLHTIVNKSRARACSQLDHWFIIVLFCNGDNALTRSSRENSFYSSS